MRAPMAFRLLLALALLVGAGSASPGQTRRRRPIRSRSSWSACASSRSKATCTALTALSASGTSTDEFVRAMTPAPTELVIKERDRAPLPGGGMRLLLEMFSMRVGEARVFTWQMDLDAATCDNPATWRIARLDRLSIVSGLFKLSLDLAAAVRRPQSDA